MKRDFSFKFFYSETPIVFLLMIIVSCGLFYLGLLVSNTITLSIYLAIILFFFLFKQIFSSLNKSYSGPVPTGLSVWAVIPVYNEDQGVLLKCIKSIMLQTHSVGRVFIVDDGSENDCCGDEFLTLISKYNNIEFIRFDENRGKRLAEYEVFKRIDNEFIATIDSDTVLEKEAIAEGLKAFSNSDVSCVCGNVEGLNSNQNLLTRLINLRLKNAFLIERASLSYFGAILCSSGMFSIHRANHIKLNLNDYVRQKYLGKAVSVGNDRRLSFYALKSGKIVFQKSAKAKSILKSSLSEFLKQQIRWNRSTGREMPIWLFQFPLNSCVFWVTLMEYVKYLTSFLLVLSFFFLPGRLEYFWFGITSGYFILHSWLRYLKLVYSHPIDVLVSPILGLLHLTMLFPIKLYSLLTMHKTGWLTR